MMSDFIINNGTLILIVDHMLSRFWWRHFLNCECLFSYWCIYSL